jgi:hypothetical protein
MIFCRFGSDGCDSSPYFRFCKSGGGALEGNSTEEINGISGVGGEDGNACSRSGKSTLPSR